MTFKNLSNILKIENGEIALSFDSFNCDFNDLFSKNILNITDAKITKSSESKGEIYLSGYAKIFNTNSQINGIFWISKSGELELFISFELSDSGNNKWTFKNDFPDLPLFQDFGSGMSVGVPITQEIDISNPSYKLCSSNYEDKDTDSVYNEGLNFYGNVNSNSFEVIQALLSGKTPSGLLKIQGTINVNSKDVDEINDFPWALDKPPGINLRVDLDVNIEEDYFSFSGLSFILYTPISVDWLSNNMSYSPAMGFSGFFTLSKDSNSIPGSNNSNQQNNGDSIGCHATALITPGISELSLYGEFQNLNFGKITELAGQSIDSKITNLPEPLNEISNLGLLAVGCTINFGNGISLAEFSIKVGWTDLKAITLNTAKFEIDSIIGSLNFQLGENDNSLNTESNSGFSLDLYATFKTLDTTFVIGGAYNNGLTIYGGLMEGETLSLSDFMKAYGTSNTSLPTGDLLIDRLQLILTLGKNGNYQFALGMADKTKENPKGWAIDLGMPRLKEIDISDIFLNLNYNQSDSSFSGSLGGSISIPLNLPTADPTGKAMKTDSDSSESIDLSLSADLDFSKDSKSVKFTADATSNISLTQLIGSLVHEDVSMLPDFELTELKFEYDSDGPISIDAKFSIGTEEVSLEGDFSFTKEDDQYAFVAKVELDPTEGGYDIGAQLPVVGSELKNDFVFKGAYLIVASDKVDSLSVDGVKLEGGITLNFEVTLDGDSQILTLPLKKPSQDTKSNEPESGKMILAAGGAASSTNSGSVSTISIKKKIGPIYLESIGLGYQDGLISAILNASLALGPLTFSVEGLSISNPTDKLDISASIKGMGVDFNKGGIQIDGAILNVTPPPENVKFQLDGDLIVQVESIGLSALASYAQLNNGAVSLFVYVDVNATLGGPGFFIVEGLMGGFGYNRTLRLPDVTEVTTFPLMAIGENTSSPTDESDSGREGSDVSKENSDVPQVSDPNSPMGKAMSILDDLETGEWIPIKEGDYWIAAGIKYSSFEILKGQLLLVAEFGKDLQFAALGTSNLDLPVPSQASPVNYVSLELEMEAVLKPTEGYFSVAAALTSNSYVLTKECHVTGGFAFDIWYGTNPNAGQFVLTVGGYHPAFTPPSYYPKVARLGINWQVSSSVLLKGGSYFAITPSCGMAGGSWALTYQSTYVRVWFTAEANLLMTWNPFTFVAEIAITIGASVNFAIIGINKTVTASLSASLNLWGPPIGGIVKLHVIIVDVTVSFGSDNAANLNTTPLTWDKFKVLLPKQMCVITAAQGLQSSPNSSERQSDAWMVRAGDFTFACESSVPISSLLVNNSVIESGPDISIRPMFEKESVEITGSILIKNMDTGNLVDNSDWNLNAVEKEVSTTLWGDPIIVDNKPVQGPTTPSNDTISKIVGCEIISPQSLPDGGLPSFNLSLLDFEDIDTESNLLLSSDSKWNIDFIPKNEGQIVMIELEKMDQKVVSQRTELYNLFSNSKLYKGKSLANKTMNNMANNADKYFTEDPMVLI